MRVSRQIRHFHRLCSTVYCESHRQVYIRKSLDSRLMLSTNKTLPAALDRPVTVPSLE